MTEPSRTRAAVPLLQRPVTVHAWEDVVFAHWRHDPASLARLVPRGTRPDVVDGSAWAGLSRTCSGRRGCRRSRRRDASAR